MASGSGNGKDAFEALRQDVENLKSSSREIADGMELLNEQMTSLSERMTSLSERMTSLSETMAETAKTAALIAKGVSRQSERSREHERLYGRLAKTLIAFKDTTDDRFGRLEARVRRLERSAVRP